MNSDRLASIDIFRALTMLLMIFVIDISSLTNIPNWLAHAAANEDRMGLADIVFPCFMFILGASIPHAISARLNTGKTKKEVFVHIANRTLSLILMGGFIVNLDNMNSDFMIIEKSHWQILMFLAFLMIWNDYQLLKVMGVISSRLIQVVGGGLLVFLAIIYRGGDGVWMQVHWWGILGLLGWSYGLCSVLYLFIGNRIMPMVLLFLSFLILNINEFVGALNVKLVISASNYLSVMLGVLSTILFTQLNKLKTQNIAISALICVAFLLIAFGILTRPEWDISKIRATPSWTTICGGISILCFLTVWVITDIQKCVSWAKPISAGGSATLTCYFIPYLIYAILDLSGFKWPEVLSSSYVGLIKSLCFSLLIIQLTAWAGKFNIKFNI